MKRWYVIQVYTGFEDIVKRDLEKRIEEESAQSLIDEVLIPAGEIVHFFAQDGIRKEKILPGYLLVHMEMVGEAYRLVSSTPRITRFLGGEAPVALSEKEVQRIFSQMSGRVSLSSVKESFVVGGEVGIANGPFSGFVGIVDKVDEDKERLTVMVSIFGRMTPVELGFDQVKR